MIVGFVALVVALSGTGGALPASTRSTPDYGVLGDVLSLDLTVLDVCGDRHRCQGVVEGERVVARDHCVSHGEREVVDAGDPGRRTETLGDCQAGDRVRVRTYDVSAAALQDKRFLIWLED